MKKYTIESANQLKPERSRLTVLGYSTLKNTRRQVRCICTCNRIIDCFMYDVVKGKVLSCGCLNREILIKRNTKYANNILKIGSVYRRMISRCYNLKNVKYHNYGGRGVTVCEEWLNNYPAFLKWAKENGWKEGLELDKDIRIPGNKIYSPETCLFVTHTENNNNRSDCKKYLIDGQYLTVAQISRKLNIHENTLRWRIKHNRNKGQLFISTRKCKIAAGVSEEEIESSRPRRYNLFK